MDFGASGSGVVRQWKQYDTVLQKQTDIQNQQTSRPVYQYSFAGPLTMSKGCDRATNRWQRAEYDIDTPLLTYNYRGSNPAVVTDATCYMDWIAEQYELRLENGYESKASCSQSSGDKEDINQDVCRTAQGNTCNFTYPGYESCRLYTEEGIAKNVFQCVSNQVSAVQCYIVR